MSGELVHVTTCLHCAKQLVSEHKDGLRKQMDQHFRNCPQRPRHGPDEHAFLELDDGAGMGCACGVTLTREQVGKIMAEAIASGEMGPLQ